MQPKSYRIQDVRMGHVLKNNQNTVYVVVAMWYPGPKQYDLFDTEKMSIRQVTSLELRSGLEEGKLVRFVPEIERKVVVNWHEDVAA